MNNSKTILGRLTRDPELKTVKAKDGEMALANFTVAVSNDYPREDASFYDCYMFGKKAEVINKYFKKGSQIYLFGEHQQEPYEKDGKTMRPWKFKVADFNFVANASGSDKTKETVEPAFTDDNEDIPF